jgi:hypothetical protein
VVVLFKPSALFVIVSRDDTIPDEALGNFSDGGLFGPRVLSVVRLGSVLDI